MIPLLLAYQLATASADDALKDLHFNLRDVRPSSADDSIVVVGRRLRSQHLDPLPEMREEPLIPRAEIPLFGNARGSVDVEQVQFGNGTVSNRVMARIKMKF